MTAVTPERTPEQQAAIDRAKRGARWWFGRVPIRPSRDHEEQKIVPVAGRLVRR